MLPVSAGSQADEGEEMELQLVYSSSSQEALRENPTLRRWCTDRMDPFSSSQLH